MTAPLTPLAIGQLRDILQGFLTVGDHFLNVLRKEGYDVLLGSLGACSSGVVVVDGAGTRCGESPAAHEVSFTLKLEGGKLDSFVVRSAEPRLFQMVVSGQGKGGHEG